MFHFRMSAERFVQRIIPIGVDAQGKRSRAIELLAGSFENLSTASEPVMTPSSRIELVSTTIPDMLRRDLVHKGLLSESVTMSWRLLAWIELNGLTPDTVAPGSAEKTRA